jgi:hypothetical protein
MPKGGLNRSAIRRMMQDIQREFDKNGSIQVPIEVETSPSLVGEVVPGIGAATFGDSVVQGDISALDMESSAIRLLDWLYDNSNGSDFLSVDEFVAGDGGDNEKAYILGKHVERNGWANVVYTLGPHTDASISSDGIVRVERIRQLRRSRAARASDLQRQMLNWLYERQEEGDHPQSWEPFAQTGASHLLGQAFGAEEIERQAQYLTGLGLVSATSIEEEEPGGLNPRLTTSGQECVLRFNGEVGKYMDRTAGQGGSQNYYGAVVQGNADGAQFAWNNQQVTQNSSGGVVNNNFKEFAEIIESILSSLPQYELSADDASDARDVADEILAEVVKPEPDPRFLRRARASIIGFLAPVAAGASTGAGEGAQQLARQAIESLGAAF